MIEITKDLVSILINEQFPEWSNLELKSVEKQGHDNRTFYLGDRMMVRLPSGQDYVAQIEKEAKYLPYLSKYLSLPITKPIAIGKASLKFPFVWSINSYLEGETASQDNVVDKISFANDLSNFLNELQSIDPIDAPLPGKHNFYRGANPDIYSKEVYHILEKNKDNKNINKLYFLWEKAISSNWDKKPVWIHGDIALGNLLVKKGKLCGVIDFGIMGIGDPACDYAISWTFFDEKSRKYFLNNLDEKTIDRARGWALWKALITYNDFNDEIATTAKYTLKEIIKEYDNIINKN